MKFNSIVAAGLVVISLSSAGCASMTELDGLLSTIPNVTVDEDGIVRVVKKPQPLPSTAPAQNELVMPLPSAPEEEVAPAESAEPVTQDPSPTRRWR